MIIAATGHRPDKLGGYNISASRLLISIAEQYLKQQIELHHIAEKKLTVITGMALGWDTIVAIVCADLRIPYIAAIPCINQEKTWNYAAQTLYNFLIQRAEEIVFVSNEPYSPELMQLRNEYMVNRADSILAMHDGSAGGTGNCVKYARQQKKPIVNLYSLYKTLSR